VVAGDRAEAVEALAQGSEVSAPGPSCSDDCSSVIASNSHGAWQVRIQIEVHERDRVTLHERSAARSPSFGHFWVMRNGSAGKYGNPGNEESATYTFPDPPVGSNPLSGWNPGARRATCGEDGTDPGRGRAPAN
jgi:hypothetical protein